MEAKHLLNTGQFLPDKMAQYPRTQSSSESFLCYVLLTGRGSKTFILTVQKVAPLQEN
jgi:hypothetical protein